eukprot:44202-Eustigmatos_ZCMA.PRE.1
MQRRGTRKREAFPEVSTPSSCPRQPSAAENLQQACSSRLTRSACGDVPMQGAGIGDRCARVYANRSTEASMNLCCAVFGICCFPFMRPLSNITLLSHEDLPCFGSEQLA